MISQDLMISVLDAKSFIKLVYIRYWFSLCWVTSNRELMGWWVQQDPQNKNKQIVSYLFDNYQFATVQGSHYI